MDFVTSATASKAVPTQPPTKFGADRDHDSAGQEAGFEEEIAALRDAAAESANTEGDLLPASPKAGADKDGAGAERALNDPLAQDFSEVEMLGSDETDLTDRDAFLQAPSEESTATRDVRSPSDAVTQTADAEGTGPQPQSHPFAVGTNLMPDARIGKEGADETLSAGAKQGAVPATSASMPQLGTLSSPARSGVAEAGPLGDNTDGISNASRNVPSKHDLNGPVSGLHGGASRPGASSDATLTAAPLTPVVEGTDQSGTVAKTDYGGRLGVAGKEVILAKPGAVPSPAANAVQGLPPGTLPGEASVRAMASGPDAEPVPVPAQVQGPNQDRHSAMASVLPSAGRHREQIPEAAVRYTQPGQTTPGADPAAPTGATSPAMAISGGVAVTPSFVPTNPVMVPLFAGQAGIVREGVRDATVFGADLAALETGRAQPGTIIAGSALAAEPRGVARQIAEALIAAHGNGIDLQLSPEELGRVKLSITPGEAGLLVTVSAERPETLELLRRHIDLLGEEFAALGLGDTSFSFGDSSGHTAAGDPHPTQNDTLVADLADSTEPEPAAVSTAHPRADSGLLDIRL